MVAISVMTGIAEAAIWPAALMTPVNPCTKPVKKSWTLPRFSLKLNLASSLAGWILLLHLSNPFVVVQCPSSWPRVLWYSAVNSVVSAGVRVLLSC